MGDVLVCGDYRLMNLEEKLVQSPEEVEWERSLEDFTTGGGIRGCCGIRMGDMVWGR